MDGGPRVSVLIPALDEAATIGTVLERIGALPIDPEIIVVDDGSADGTREIVAAWLENGRSGVVIEQPHRGKGAAIRTALGHATADVCVIQDADTEYDPADIPRLIEPIARNRADAVYGSRLRAHNEFGRLQLFGNRAVSLTARILYGTTLTDIETGYKAFRTAALRSLPLTEDGFGIEPEITAWACRLNLRIAEVPISYHPRTYQDGKKITWRDGVRALHVLIASRFRRPSGAAGYAGRPAAPAATTSSSSAASRSAPSASASGSVSASAVTPKQS